MTWIVMIAGPAQQQFRKLPQKEQARVKAVMLSMESEPFQGDLKRLQGKPSSWRRRVGHYRILFDLDFENREIVIHGILRRTTTTYEGRTFSPGASSYAPGQLRDAESACISPCDLYR